MEKTFFESAGGRRLCGILNDPVGNKTSPLAVLVHGLGSSKDSTTNVMLEEVLLGDEMAVFRFDLFGHGESQGEFADLTHTKAVEDALAALEHARGLGYSRIGLVGSSFGGFASVRAAAASGIPEFLALKSPVVTDIIRVFGVLFEDLFDRWEEQGFIEYIGVQGETRRLNYTFYQDAVRYAGYDFARGISIPVFIVHGTADEIVPFEQSSGLAAVLPDCRLEAMEGADHRYTDPGHFKRMIELVSGFLTERFEKKG